MSSGGASPELGREAPEVTDPFPDRIKAREAELRTGWAGTELSDDRMGGVTGVTFRSLDESRRDCVESVLAVGGVKPRLRASFTQPA